MLATKVYMVIVDLKDAASECVATYTACFLGFFQLVCLYVLIQLELMGRVEASIISNMKLGYEKSPQPN